jgi:hypothetical protein
MVNRSLLGGAVLSLVALATMPAHAQTAPPTAPDQAQLPATSSGAVPDATPAVAPKPDKKVWTNEDMPGRAPATDATAQPGSAGSGAPNARPKGSASNRDAKWYHDQIARLQDKLPPLDKQIADLQAAISGKPTGDARTSTRPTGVKTDDWATQLRDLQKQRDDIVAKIAALQDEARHKGVSPNALP